MPTRKLAILGLGAGMLTSLLFTRPTPQKTAITFTAVLPYSEPALTAAALYSPTTTTTTTPTTTTPQTTPPKKQPLPEPRTVPSQITNHRAFNQTSRGTTRTPQAAPPSPTTTTLVPTELNVDVSARWQPTDMPPGCTPNGSKETIAEVAYCWDHLVSRWAWPSKAKVFRVMQCESRGRANATNGRYHGLMQEDGGSFNPQDNLARTWEHSRHGTNWSPWTCQ